jgi:ATP-binding cassette subfamily B protein RaxB
MPQRLKVQPIAQDEQNECALACIAMIANAHGARYTLSGLRQKFTHFGRGATLRDLLSCSNHLELAARPLKAEIEDLNKLELPCILHFDFNHFVVLVQIKRGQKYQIVDPASGARTIEADDLSRRYTGIAVELRPTPSFGKAFASGENRRSELFSLSDHRKSIALYVAINTANLSIALLAPLSIQILVDKVIPGQDYYLLAILTIVFAAIGIISVFGRYTADKFNTTQSGRLQYFTTFKYINLLLGNKAGFFLNRPLGHYVAQYNSINYLVNHVVVDVGSAITDMMFIVIVVCVLVFMDSGISALLMATSAIVIGIRWLVARRTRTLQREVVGSAAQDESYFWKLCEVCFRSRPIAWNRFGTWVASTRRSARS